MRKILYVDMDNVLVDFESSYAHIPPDILKAYEGRPEEIPGIFGKMKPIPNAIDSFLELSRLFDTYILSTSPWENPSALADKLQWVKTYLGDPAYKRLIFSHHKNLNRGDYLIDDRNKHGADRFQGEHILFGSERFPEWGAVMSYLREKS